MNIWHSPLQWRSRTRWGTRKGETFSRCLIDLSPKPLAGHWSETRNNWVSARNTNKTGKVSWGVIHLVTLSASDVLCNLTWHSLIENRSAHHQQNSAHQKSACFLFGKHIYTIYISLYQPLTTTYLPLSTLPILRLPPGWKRAQCFKPNLSPASMVMMGSPEGTNGIPRLKLWIERTWSGQMCKVFTWGLGVMKQKRNPLTAPLSSYDVLVLLTSARWQVI